jgi:hypothetical protein
LLHCRFSLWNFSLGEDFGHLEFLDRLASLTIFCLRDLAGSFSLGFDFSLRCLQPLDSMVFQTLISGFLGLSIFGLDLLHKSLGEAVRPGCPPVRPASVQPVASPLFCCPPSDKTLDVFFMLLLGDFGIRISARDGRLVS